MAHVIEINSIEELDHYHLVWNSLYLQTRNPSFFQTLDWLQAYWRKYGEEQSLRVLIVYSDGSPIGIVPLVVFPESTRIGRVRVLTYPLHDWGSFYGPIGSNPTATLIAAMHHLHTSPRDWDMLDLRWVDKENLDHGRTKTAMQSTGFQSHEQVWKETAVVRFNGSWEDYLLSRTTKFRNNLRRHQRRVEKCGEVTYERFRPLGAKHNDSDPHWDLYDECVGLAERSWQGSSKDGTTLSHKSVRGFFREVHELAAKHGAVDISLIRIDGKAAAFGYNYHCQGRVIGMRIGYDPAFHKTGIGNVLYSKVFQNCIESGDHSFDMGTGSMEIKKSWLTYIERSYRYTHYPLAAPKAQILRMKHWAQSRWAESGLQSEPTLAS